ncbi:MAG: sensor domain-containing protein [Mycobacterium sp.]
MLATLALTVVIVVGVVTAVAMTGSGSHREAQPQVTTTDRSSPPSPAPAVPISALAGLLLPAEEISRIMASDPLAVDLRDDSMFDDSALITDQTCLSAWMPVEKNVYDNTGWTAVQSQILRAHPKEIWELSVIQAVVAFPSATKAAGFFTNQSATWSRCGEQTITHNVIGGSEQKWDFTGMRTTDRTVTLSSSRQGGGGFCERALTTRGNVAVDVLACRPEYIGNEGGTIVSNIADKIPQ